MGYINVLWARYCCLKMIDKAGKAKSSLRVSLISIPYHTHSYIIYRYYSRRAVLIFMFRVGFLLSFKRTDRLEQHRGVLA